MLDPAAAKLLSYNIWNPPNMPGSFSSTGPVSNYTYDPPSRTFTEYFSGRVDHQFNPKNKIYGSYTYNHGNGLQRPTSIPRAFAVFDGTTGYNTPSTSQNYSVGVNASKGKMQNFLQNFLPAQAAITQQISQMRQGAEFHFWSLPMDRVYDLLSGEHAEITQPHISATRF